MVGNISIRCPTLGAKSLTTLLYAVRCDLSVSGTGNDNAVYLSTMSQYSIRETSFLLFVKI